MSLPFVKFIRRGMCFLSVFSVPFSMARAAAPVSRPADTSENKAQIVRNYGKLPLRFEANQGQADKGVKFLSHGSGYGLYLTGQEAVLTLTKRTAKGSKFGLGGKTAAKQAVTNVTTDVVRMRLSGAHPNAEPVGVDPLPGTANYFIGNDPAQWKTNVPAFGKVRYAAVYPGVDLIYYGNQQQLEYDFVVAPGADPDRIKFSFLGARRLTLQRNGDLRIVVGDRTLALKCPYIYQNDAVNMRRRLSGRYVLDAHNREVRFRIGSYDKHKALIIDPPLIFSTTFPYGGIDSIAVDNKGSVYATGSTGGSLPVSAGAPQSIDTHTNQYLNTAFVIKFNPAGTEIEYATYLGGSILDAGEGIAVDSANNAYVTGYTESLDFPTTPGAFQRNNPTTGAAFITKLNPSGTSFVYSTLLSGQSVAFAYSSYASAIAVDSFDNAYVTGYTNSPDFPTTGSAFQRSIADGYHVFVTGVNSTGTALVGSTYLGGTGDETGLGIAVATSGNPGIYVTGDTSSTDFPISSSPIPALQATNLAASSGGRTAFLSILDLTAHSLLYSTYFGGSKIDQGNGIAVGQPYYDSSNNVNTDIYMIGLTFSSDFPIGFTTPKASVIRSSLGGFEDAFFAHFVQVAAFDVNPVCTTYLGGQTKTTHNQ